MTLPNQQNKSQGAASGGNPQFNFDHVFDIQTPQQQVYKSVGKPIVEGMGQILRGQGFSVVKPGVICGHGHTELLT